jgi:hypothetical protein
MYIPFDKKIIKQKTTRKLLLVLIILFPILFGVGMYWLRSINYPLYREIGREDGIIEWLQFFLFGASGVIAFILALKFKKVSRLMFVIFLIVSLGLIFVAGEEISWGQRIFNIDGHEVFDGESEIPVLKYNVQSETNIHNFKVIHSKIGYVYLAIGAYGCFAWVVMCILDKIFDFKRDIRKFLKFFVSPPYLFFYFFPLAVNILPRMGVSLIPPDYEMGEFVFSLGVFLCLLLCFTYFKKSLNKRKKRE